MTTYFAQSSTNINGANVWNTVANGSGSYLTWPPASGDVLMANNKTITVNVDANLGATGEVRTDTTGGATVGGYFDLAAGVTLTANAFAGAAGTQCIRFNGAAPNVAYVVGNATCTNSSQAVNNTGTGYLTITGNCTGSSAADAYGARNASTGTITVNGNSNGGNFGAGCCNVGAGTIALTGTATGGAGSTAYGIWNYSTGTVTVSTGATGGTNAAAHGALNESSGTLTVNGTVTAAISGAAGLFGKNSAGYTYAGGALVSSEFGHTPIQGFVRIAVGPSTRWTFRDSTLSTQTFIPAEYAGEFGVPAITDVRYGTSYALGALTGTCNIPAAASVLYGVPVDATTGTVTITAADIRSAIGLASANLDTQLAAIPTTGLTAQQVWEYATRTLTAGSGITAQDVWEYATREITGGTVTTLTNSPDVPTEAEIAAQVRTELTPELERVANCATVESTGDQLAGLL